MNFLSTFLTKSPAIPQQLYKTATHSLSAIAELVVVEAIDQWRERHRSCVHAKAVGSTACELIVLILSISVTCIQCDLCKGYCIVPVH